MKQCRTFQATIASKQTLPLTSRFSRKTAVLLAVVLFALCAAVPNAARAAPDERAAHGFIAAAGEAASSLLQEVGDRISRALFGDFKYEVVVNPLSETDFTTLQSKLRELERAMAGLKSQGLTVTPSAAPQVIERVTEHVVSDLSSADLRASESLLRSEIARIASNLSAQNSATYAVAALSNRIDHLQNVTIAGATITGSTFTGSLTGTTLSAETFSVSGTATSTFANGIDLSDGCFAVDGTCIGGGNPGGSDTQVQFNDGGVFGGDSNFVWDNVTKRLGIGTTSPYAKLSVVGEVVSSFFTATTTTATSTFTNINIAGNLWQNGSPLASSQWTTSGSDIYYTTGKVGIGTTSPWGQLSVNPNGITGPAFVVGSSTATKLIVTNGGNVGIGTTTPNATSYSGSVLTISDTGINRVGALELVGRTSLESQGVGMISFHNAASGNSFGNRVGFIMVAREGGADNSSAMKFYVSNAGSVSSFFILTSSGNLGIGTTSPWRKNSPLPAQQASTA